MLPFLRRPFFIHSRHVNFTLPVMLVVLPLIWILAAERSISAQGLSPTTPSKEYIYVGGKLVAVDEPLSAPTAPGSLVASPVSGTQINLTWTDNSTNETQFKIERKTGVGGTYAQINTVAANSTSYSDTGLSPSTTYYYRIRGNNTAGDSVYSNEANATTTNTAPAAPSGLGLTVNSSSQITLNWTDNSTNETGFKIERKTGVGGTYSQIATVAANITTYPNTGLSASTTYYYRVRAYNGIGDSAYSNEANATTQAPPTPPAAPSGLTATKISTSQINLSWTDTSGNESGFRIERKLGVGGTYSEIAVVGINVTTYSNTGLNNGSVYYYRVRAYNGAGNSSYSNEANACTGTLFSAGTYDSNSANVVYTGSWALSTSYPLSWATTLNYSSTTNDKATFSFSGDDVTYVFTKDGFRGIANVKVDGLDKGNLDLYTPSGPNLNKLFQVAKSYSGLGAGNHTIEITLTGTKNGSSGGFTVDVDALIVGISTVGPNATPYDERVANVKWIGSWTQSSYTGAYNNTLTSTTSQFYASTLTFTGTQVTYYYSKHSQRGIAQVTIDGVDKGTIDLFYNGSSPPGPLLQQTTTYPSLGSGIHTIHVEVTGTKNASSTGTLIDIDAFKVQ
ncbi:MAG: fibronectin type III domain-containing protein [Terriglobia bacterium]